MNDDATGEPEAQEAEIIPPPRRHTGGRQKMKLDADMIEALASKYLSAEEIGTILRCSPDTLQRRYSAALRRGRNRGAVSLKRKQYELAMQGDKTMLIWLGKQYLGQKDVVDLTHRPGSASGARPVDTMTEAEIDAELAQLEARESAAPAKMLPPSAPRPDGIHESDKTGIPAGDAP